MEDVPRPPGLPKCYFCGRLCFYSGGACEERQKWIDERKALRSLARRRVICRYDQNEYIGWYWDVASLGLSRILNLRDIETEDGWEQIGLAALVNDF